MAAAAGEAGKQEEPAQPANGDAGADAPFSFSAAIVADRIAEVTNLKPKNPARKMEMFLECFSAEKLEVGLAGCGGIVRSPTHAMPPIAMLRRYAT